MPVQFRQYFKDIAEAETRSVTIFENHSSGLPPGEYGFVEYYCNEKNCDCRRVHLMVVANWTDKPLAMIAYGWESPSHYEKWMRFPDKKMAAGMSGVSLEILFDQSRYANAAKKLFEDVLLADFNYVQRIKRHYQMMRNAVDAKTKNGYRPSLSGQPAKPRSKKIKKAKSKSPVPIVLPEGFRIEKLISPEIVCQALLSSIDAVRIAASQYFDGNDTALEIPDCGVMQTTIQAIEKFGYANSLGMIEDRRFPQNEATVRWITGELDKDRDLGDILTDNYCFCLAEMLCTADPCLLTANMVDLRCFPKEKKDEFLVRLELAGKSWDELWNAAFDYDQEHEIEIWEALARHTDRKETVLNALQGNDPMVSGDLLEEMTPNLTNLVAEMKIVEALPWISQQIREVDKRGVRSIFLDNMIELPHALAVIADEETLDMFCSRWLEQPHRHTWFVDVVTGLKTPWSMNACLKVLQKRNLDEDTRRFVIEHLVENFVTEALPMILAFDPELATDRSQRQNMVVAYMVNPFIGFDQFAKWKTEAEKYYWGLSTNIERYRNVRIRDFYRDDEIDDEDDFDFEDEWDDEDFDDESSEVSDYPGTIRNTKPHVGRNDPCPCGSGKKFKKCCLK